MYLHYALLLLFLSSCHLQNSAFLIMSNVMRNLLQRAARNDALLRIVERSLDDEETAVVLPDDDATNFVGNVVVVTWRSVAVLRVTTRMVTRSTRLSVRGVALR